MIYMHIRVCIYMYMYFCTCRAICEFEAYLLRFAVLHTFLYERGLYDAFCFKPARLSIIARYTFNTLVVVTLYLIYVLCTL